jgi:tRNA (cmo5U34)-methyltransferase
LTRANIKNAKDHWRKGRGWMAWMRVIHSLTDSPLLAHMQNKTGFIFKLQENRESTMSKDSLYQRIPVPVPPFEFDAQVAGVFDDMIHRSVPFYSEIIDRQVQLIERFHQPGTVIYDLGCSNGNLGIRLARRAGAQPRKIVAVDSSAPMLAAFRERLTSCPLAQHIALQCEDIRRTPIENASVVVLNFTLQFVPPQDRDALMTRIHKGLAPGGILLCSEKISHTDAGVAELQRSFHYAFKRENGYSDLEISRKREALEKVLIPESLESHQQRLNRAGFTAMDIWLKWFNFAALIAIK